MSKSKLFYLDYATTLHYLLPNLYYIKGGMERQRDEGRWRDNKGAIKGLCEVNYGRTDGVADLEYVSI